MSNKNIEISREELFSKICEAVMSYDEEQDYESDHVKKFIDKEFNSEYEVNGNTSDGFHTFNELYHHRAVLFSVICNSKPDKAWKSKLHDDGTMFDGMFIVGINTPEGQATYHYDIDPYWEMFKVKELPNAPKFDGHTPEDAINRISKLNFNFDEHKYCEFVLSDDIT